MLVLLALACRPPAAPPSEAGFGRGPEPLAGAVAQPALRELGRDPLPDRLPTPAGPHHGLPGTFESPVQHMGERLRDVTLDPDRGATLTAMFKDLPPRRKQAGIAGFTPDVLSDRTVCEQPLLVAEHDDGGETWRGRYAVWPWVYGFDDPFAIAQEMSSGCEAAIAAHDGDVDAAHAEGKCSNAERYSFFGAPDEDNACKTCVTGAGDFATCVASEACADPTWARAETTDADTGEKFYWYITGWNVLACAPDWEAFAYVSVDPVDGDLPRPFDAERWKDFCYPMWDESFGDWNYFCSGGLYGGHALGEGVNATVFDLVPKDAALDEGVRPWHGRSALIPRVVMDDNRQLRWQTMTNPGDGAISAAVENGGFGLDPYLLRPDGEDASDPNDTWAWEWWAIVSMKHATTREGILFSPALYNRCADGAWAGPDALGRYKCTDTVENPGGAPWPHPDVPFNDDASFLFSENQEGPWFPLGPATLASSGRPDPSIPGGYVTYVAGSDTIADPDWDACAWPDTFVPDLIQGTDLARDGFDGDPESLTLETYRFDKPENDHDIVAVVRVDEARGFCPAGEDGLGWRTFENLP